MAVASQILLTACLLYTSDAADERSSVDLGGRRIIKKKTKRKLHGGQLISLTQRDLTTTNQTENKK